MLGLILGTPVNEILVLVHILWPMHLTRSIKYLAYTSPYTVQGFTEATEDRSFNNTPLTPPLYSKIDPTRRKLPHGSFSKVGSPFRSPK